MGVDLSPLRRLHQLVRLRRRIVGHVSIAIAIATCHVEVAAEHTLELVKRTLSGLSCLANH